MGLRVALCLPLDWEDRYADHVRRHGHEVVARCAAADELALLLARDRPDLVLAAGSPRYLNARLLAEADAAGTRILAVVASDLERRQVAELGLLESVDVTSEQIPLEGLAPLPPLPARPAPGDRGVVIAVWGPAGAPGRTTVAISLAAELAAAGRSVALGDVDTHGASVAPALGLLDEAPGFAAACRLAGAESLTLGELERIGQRYESPSGGFWVLTGIGRPSRWPELSAERVEKTIDACRDWVEYTVLDTGFSLENDEEIASDLFAPRRNAATIAALRRADHVVAVGSAEPVGLSRFLRAHVDLVETVPTTSLTVVMNKVRASAIGLSPRSQVVQTLERFGGIHSPVLIPHDQQALDASILSGKTLVDVAPRSPARLAVQEWAASRVLPPTPAPEVRPRRRLRLPVGRREAAGLP